VIFHLFRCAQQPLLKALQRGEHQKTEHRRKIRSPQATFLVAERQEICMTPMDYQKEKGGRAPFFVPFSKELTS
jgi:hypothetical protein